MENKLTEFQERFLDLLYEDGLPDDFIERCKDIKERAGYSAITSLTSILRPLKDEIAKRNQEWIVFNSTKPIKVLQDIVRTPTLPGSDNAIKAANSLLDRAGIGKKEQHEVEIRAIQGIVILPAKKE